MVDGYDGREDYDDEHPWKPRPGKVYDPWEHDGTGYCRDHYGLLQAISDLMIIYLRHPRAAELSHPRRLLCCVAWSIRKVLDEPECRCDPDLRKERDADWEKVIQRLRPFRGESLP